MNYDELLAPAAKAMRPSGIRKFFDLAADMPHCISLGVGEPDFKTPWSVRDAGIRSLELGRTKYTANAGLKDLRKEICTYLQRRFELHYQEENVLVTVGGSEAIDLAIRALVQPGDEVIIPEPCFVCYEPITQLTGGVPVHIATRAEDQFRLTADQLRAAITPKTKLLIFPYPNNPTGATYNREQLKAWVDYALDQKAVILFDAAYEAFITDPSLPHSIFEIPGAEKCAIEFCSFSKTAGFTGMRCGYTVIRKELVIDGVQVSKLWQRRQGCKFNGTSYITQRAAAAVFTEEGQKQIRETIAYYQKNAQVMMDAFTKMGVWFTGGTNSPYIWLKCPDGMGSWEYFDYLLHNAEIVGTPGEGFGKNGEGYFRLTAFGDAQKTVEAMERIQKLQK